jgi:hypothetical protein
LGEIHLRSLGVKTGKKPLPLVLYPTAGVSEN